MKILNENYKFKKIIYKGIEIIYFNNDTMLVIISNKKNVFKISREQFIKIDDELLPYAFLLIDETTEELYFMQYKEPNNQLRYSFEKTAKNEIYFGKEILQNKIGLEDLKRKINYIEKI